MKQFTLFLFFALLSVQIFAQKKVLGYPEAYVAPLSPYDLNTELTFTSSDVQKNKVRHRGWWVVVDRNNVKAHQRPNASSNTLQTVNFAQPFYVTENDGDWYYLIDAIVDRTTVTKVNKKIGWVHKDNLLLWNEGLLNPRTKIHLKSLLLNKLDKFQAIPCDRKEIVKAYLSPMGETLRDSINIYKFYFVYKFEGNRCLLGETPQLSRYDTKDRLLGWVNIDRMAEWNTRVALEPNYTQAGYDERKNNDKFRITGFDDSFAAEEYANSGQREAKYVAWKRDPVSSVASDLAVRDKKRFRGDFMRFPLLSIGGQANAKRTLPFFKSAVCDEVVIKIQCVDGKIVKSESLTASEHGDVVKKLEKYQLAGKNFNVFFVIEGSSEMIPYQDEMEKLADNIASSVRSRAENARLKFGALVYKDVTESDNPDNLIVAKELTSDRDAFKRFIRNADFSSPNSNFNYPIQNYGIYKALQKANFPKYHTNVIVVIGNKGDFSYDRLIKMKYKASAANIKINKITDAINESNVNIIAVQTNGDNLQSYAAFPRQMRGVILDAARKNFNRKFVSNTESKSVLTSVGYAPKSPEMSDPDEIGSLDINLENGTMQGNVIRMLGEGVAMPAVEFGQLVNELVKITVEDNIQLANKLENWKYDKVDSNDGFTPRMAEILVDMSKGIKADKSAIWVKEKFELYKEVTFARKPKQANEPSFSYVLFWPQKDLVRYYTFIEKLSVELSNANAADKRSKLRDAYCMLLEEFTGGEHSKSCMDYSIDEIYQIIQGVEREGVKFNQNNLNISCLLDRQCTTDEKIEELIQRFADVKNYLGELKNGARNEFVFKRGGEYFFWIKIEDIY